MSRARHEDWQLLDLEPGADLAAVNKALRFRRSLYQPDALATYNLLEEDERSRMLERIDDAYRRITGSEPPPFRGPQAVSPAVEEPPETPTGSPPDARTEPGALLRYHRRQRGLTMAQVAAETKIRPALLEQLESERIEDLPAAVFVRGHVLQYARALGIDNANELAALYIARHQLD
jgi:flagellar biosynthesis protein FlhG